MLKSKWFRLAPVLVVLVLLAGCASGGGSVTSQPGCYVLFGIGTCTVNTAQPVSNAPVAALARNPISPPTSLLPPPPLVQKNMDLSACEGWSQLTRAEKNRKGFFCYQHIGADPNRCSFEQALDTLGSRLPAEAKQMLLERKRTETKGDDVAVVRGDVFDAMVSGRCPNGHGQIVTNVIADFKGAKTQTVASLYQASVGGKRYMLYVIDDCSNVLLTVMDEMVPVAAVAAPAVIAQTVTGSCPNVYTLKDNVWTRSALRVPGVEQAAAAAENSKNFKPDNRVSREYGGRLRRAHELGSVSWAPTSYVVRVSLINEDESGHIIKEQLVESSAVTGQYVSKFTRHDIESWTAIRLVYPKSFISPALFAGTQEREIRFYNKLPGKSLGEWDNNPVPDCTMNVHAIAGEYPTS